MPTNCVKVVNKTVKKSAQKSWTKNVQKFDGLKVLHVFGEFYRTFKSFTQKVSTSKNVIFNLLSGWFCTFSTDTTNTINLLKEGN